MVDQVTSVDQSRQLIEAGVPTSAASMLWVHKVVDAVDGVTSHDAWELYLLSSFQSSSEQADMLCPAFTVVDLLGLLPPKLGGFDLHIGHNGMCWVLEYRMLSTIKANTLLTLAPVSFGFYDKTSLLGCVLRAVSFLVQQGITLKVS